MSVRNLIYSFVSLSCFTVLASAQEVQFSSLPAQLQLFPRDGQDSAVVEITGSVTGGAVQNARLEVYRNDSLWQNLSQQLSYSGNAASFTFVPKIHAELSEYDFLVYMDDSLVARRDSIVCGDVYLINGQSNSHPGATTYSFSSEYCRSFGRHTDYDDYNPADTTWGLSTPQGWCNTCNYAVGVWGMRLQQFILEQYGLPSCVINGGSGGSSLSYNLPDSADHLNLSTTYGRLLYRATKAGVADQVKAIFWHQGESDSGSEDAALYEERFNQLYQAWNADYAPLNKVYVFQLRQSNCGGDAQDRLRETQRSFPQSLSKVEVMSTVGLNGHDGCHYNDDGYLQMAGWVFGLVKRDFYGNNSSFVSPPNIQRAYYTDVNQNQIAVEFDQPVVWPADTLNNSMKDYFYLDGVSGAVTNGATTGDGSVILLDLNGSSVAGQLTYLPNQSYNRTPLKIYEGPWVRNQRGIGALSFYQVPIETAVSGIEAHVSTAFELEQNYPNPFNPTTTIRFELQRPGLVQLRILDTTGKLVRELTRQKFSAGAHSLIWDGRDSKGDAVSSGMYFYELLTVGQHQVRKALLLR